MYNIKLLSIFLLLGCGQSPTSQIPNDALNDGEKTSSTEEISQNKTEKDDNDPYFFQIPVKIKSENNFIYGNNENLNLTASTNIFNLQIDGCLSGYNSILNGNISSIKVYKYDKNCKAKLTSFSYAGISYEPSTSDPFTTYQADDFAVFENILDSSDTINVTVVNNFSAAILSTDTIYYRFSSIKKGVTTDRLLSANIITKSPLDGASTAAPGFTLFQTSMVGLTVANAGKFVFILECTATISGTDCINQDMNNMHYQLIEDSYGGNLLYQDAEDIFLNDPGIAVDTNTDKIDAMTNGTTNGGFQTNTGALVLLGPETLVTKPDMILIVQFTGIENSYEYFLVQMNLAN